MLLVDKVNKGKHPQKPQGSEEPGNAPGLSSLTVKPSALAGRVADLDKIKRTIHERLLTSMGVDVDSRPADVRKKIAELVEVYCEEAKLRLPKVDREELAEIIGHDVLGLGPLEQLLEDPEVSEIMVNGPKTIFIERRGRIAQAEQTFQDEVQLRRVIDRIVSSIGRRVDESHPMVDARLADGSRVNIVIAPLAVSGSSVTIRKFSRVPYKVDDLVTFGTLNHEMANFIRACVRSRISLVVSGGTGSRQAIREQAVGATALLVHQARLRDGRRCVTHISEITGIESGRVIVQDICRFEQPGLDVEGNVLGNFRFTGVVPKLLPSLKANGEEIPLETFGRSGLQVIEGRRPPVSSTLPAAVEE